MKVIPQTRHSHRYISYLRFYFYFTMSVPDEGYSTNTSFVYNVVRMTFFNNLISVPDEGKITNMSFATLYIEFLFLFYYERTWWRLFHKHVIRTTLAMSSFLFLFSIAYADLLFALHYYLRFYFYFTMSVPDEGKNPQTRHSHYISYLVLE